MEEQRKSICIIGNGIAGASLGYFLSQNNFKVKIFYANEACIFPVILLNPKILIEENQRKKIFDEAINFSFDLYSDNIFQNSVLYKNIKRHFSTKNERLLKSIAQGNSLYKEKEDYFISHKSMIIDGKKLISTLNKNVELVETKIDNITYTDKFIINNESFDDLLIATGANINQFIDIKIRKTFGEILEIKKNECDEEFKKILGQDGYLIVDGKFIIKYDGNLYIGSSFGLENKIYDRDKKFMEIFDLIGICDKNIQKNILANKVTNIFNAYRVNKSDYLPIYQKYHLNNLKIIDKKHDVDKYFYILSCFGSHGYMLAPFFAKKISNELSEKHYGTY